MNICSLIKDPVKGHRNVRDLYTGKIELGKLIYSVLKLRGIMPLDTISSAKWDSNAVNSDQIWEEIRNGREEALAELFSRYYSYLLNYGYKIVPQRAFVKDAIQELFLTIWERRNQLSKAYSVKSYLFHSFRRIILRNLTKQKNRTNRNKVYTDNFFDEIFNVEELIVHFETEKENKEKLSRAIQSLSDRQKEVIYLKFYNGLTSREISQVMGINKQSVYNHVSQAISKLQEYVQIQ